MKFKSNLTIRNKCIYFNDDILYAHIFAVHILHILRCLKIVCLHNYAHIYNFT
jgi:hypothetical protein